MYEFGFKKEVNKMGYYEQVYSKRLNRYGFDYEARIQRQREQMFDKYLLKTVYRVDIMHEGEEIAGSFERYKQDDSETLHYLLTKTSVQLAAGTVLFISNMFGENVPWMVFYFVVVKLKVRIILLLPQPQTLVLLEQLALLRKPLVLAQ